MINLSDREWKAFFISGKDGIFSIKATKSGIDKNKLIDGDDNCVPYITRSDITNGMHMFISEEQRPKYSKDAGNCITIGLDTQTVFYQPHSFYTGQNIQVLNYDGMTKYSALFIASMLKVQMKKFNWGGNGATLGRLSRTKVMLPVNHKGEPDYKFMEDYIKERMTIKREEYVEYAKCQLAQIERERVDSDAIEWRVFYLSDLFSIQRGKRLKNDDHKSGNIPYVSSSAINNGVDDYISNVERVRIFDDCLTIANSGSVGSTFYHPYHFVASDHVTGLKQAGMDKYCYLFIATLASRLNEKYNFNREINDPRIRREKILLPVKNDEPYYVYMSNCVKSIFVDKYNEYLSYAQKISC